MRHPGFVAALGIVVAFAACGDEAIVIEIDTARAPTASVELFLGIEDCTDAACEPGIQPPGAPGKLRGTIYFRDGAKRFTSTVDGDGIARFRLEPGDLDTRVLYMLAVGDQGARLLSPIDPALGPLRMRAGLEPVTRFDPDEPATSDGDGVQVWTSTDPQVASCVMFQRRRSNGEIDRTFVVPDADRDCDAIEPDRCDEYIPDASTQPTELDQARCMIVDAAQQCRIGGIACDDRNGGDVCAPLRWCTDARACQCPASTTGELAKCLDATFAPMSATQPTPRLVCTYAMRRSVDPQDPTHFDVCEPSTHVAALPLGIACDMELARSALGPYSKSQELATDDHRLRLEVEVEPNVCKAAFTLSGNVTITNPADAHVFPLKVENLATGRGMILPLEVRFVASEDVACVVDENVVGCHVEGDLDLLLRCE